MGQSKHRMKVHVAIGDVETPYCNQIEAVKRIRKIEPLDTWAEGSKLRCESCRKRIRLHGRWKSDIAKMLLRTNRWDWL